MGHYYPAFYLSRVEPQKYKMRFFSAVEIYCSDCFNFWWLLEMEKVVWFSFSFKLLSLHFLWGFYRSDSPLWLCRFSGFFPLQKPTIFAEPGQFQIWRLESVTWLAFLTHVQKKSFNAQKWLLLTVNWKMHFLRYAPNSEYIWRPPSLGRYELRRAHRQKKGEALQYSSTFSSEAD